MRRRDLLFGGGAALAASTISAEAAWQCMPPDFYGVQACEVGIPLSSYFRTAPQKCPQWCWAACIQSVFLLNRRSVRQIDIVERLFADRRCSPANGYEIVQAAGGQWVDDAGGYFDAYPSVLLDQQFGIWTPNVVNIIVNELLNNRPLINGAVGHATTITAMNVRRNQFNQHQVDAVTVRDPWPGKLNKRYLTPQEMSGTYFILKIDVV